MQVEFLIPDKPKGYIRRNRKALWTPAAKEYHTWMNKVAWCAKYVGISLPLIAIPEKPAILEVTVYLNDKDYRAYMKCGAFPDGGNITKAISDALCYISKVAKAANKKLGIKYYGDKYVYERYVGVEKGDTTETKVVLKWET